MTTQTHLPENRRPTFMISDIATPVANFFVGIYESMIHARRLQAAYRLAEHLKTTNKDFRDIALGDLVNYMMDEDNPKHLDGTPVVK